MTKEEMNDIVNNDRRTVIRKFVETLTDAGLFRYCTNCNHWSKPPNNHGCSKFQAMPPPEVIVVGCEHHSDLIPF